MKSQLYIKKEGGKAFYYLVGENTCDHCEKQIDQRAFIFLDWRGEEFTQTILCHNCLSHKPPQMPYHVLQYFSAMVRERPPSGVTPFFLKRPELDKGRINLFDAALPNAKIISDSTATRVTDRTLLSGRGDYTLLDDSAPVQIGTSDRESLDSSYRAVPPEEVDDFLKGLQNAEHILPEGDDRKQLDDKRGGK